MKTATGSRTSDLLVLGNKLFRFLLALVSTLLLAAPLSSARAVQLIASDGTGTDNFGSSVSLSGDIALVGNFVDDIGSNIDQGSAYLFRDLDSATGTVTENAKLTSTDGTEGDWFGYSASVSGNSGLVGVPGAIFSNSVQGAACLFRNLDTASGSITEDVKLTASDGAAGDHFGLSVSLSGNSALVGRQTSDGLQGSVYLFRNLDTASGTVTENAKLVASDGAAGDTFGKGLSLSGNNALVGADGATVGSNSSQGAAYFFQNLDTATGTVTEDVKLISSDGAGSDSFGYSVSLSGNTALVGALTADIGSNTLQGAAYLFRDLDTASGTVTENVKLTASDGALNDWFGSSVSLSGNSGLVGASQDDIGSNSDQGSAYLFRNLDSATGSITEDVKLTASDGAAQQYFGRSVALDGDGFVIGAVNGDGAVAYSGKAYNGTVSSVTTLDEGNSSRTIDGVSLISRTDWIIGETTSNNQVTLTTGDSADVTAAGKAVYIGKEAGSDNNILIVEGSLIADQILVSTNNNVANTLWLNSTDAGTATISATQLTVAATGLLVGNGEIAAAVAADGVIAPAMDDSAHSTRPSDIANRSAGNQLGRKGNISRKLAARNAAAPMDSAGQLAVDSSLIFQNSTVLMMEVGGLNAGTEYDQIVQTGGIGTILDGTLEISFINGFENGVQPGDSFAILVSDQPLMGAFDNVASGERLATSDGLGSFLVTYAGQNQVTLSDFQLPTLAFVSAASEKTHGGAGTFAIDLPLAGELGVECRRGGVNGDHTIVVQFSNIVTDGSASVSAGSIVGVPAFNGNEMMINLTMVPDAEQITLTVSDVKDGFGQTLPSAVVSFGVLVGDTNGDGVVNSADIGQTKAQSGQSITAANSREDVTVDGDINSADVGLVKASSGHALP